MKGYTSNLQKETVLNTNFRKVLYTAKYSQLVLMSLRPNEDIGMEVHTEKDQFFRFEKGVGKCIVDGNDYPVSDGFTVIVPAGAKHNVINLSKTSPLKFYTIYSPAGHKDGISRYSKADAVQNPETFDGVTTE